MALTEDRARRPAALSRRAFLAGTGAGAAFLLLPVSVSGAFAANPTGERLHGISVFGALKYPPGFSHFDYVAPDAPKGGRLHFAPPNWVLNQNVQTFNTLNTFVLRGDAPPRMDMCFDTLMVRALDEPDALYGHLAEWVEIGEDRNTYRFGLRTGARFHDGSAVTAEDVAFSFVTLRDDGHPSLALPLRHIAAAEALDERTVEIRYDGEQSGQAIFAAAGLPVLSKRYYTDNAFDASGLDMPLASGPYRVGRAEAGRWIEFERVADYWGRNLPTARGLDNFDVIRIDFFAERLAGFEAFKKGDIHWRQEHTSKVWATEYTFPAVTDGRVLQREFPRENRPTLQAWALNQRRERFADLRVRQAIALCFDFEWTNEKIFYGAYERSHSLFENSEFKAEGEPDAAERALMDSLRVEVPEAAFGPAVMQPTSDGSGRDRQLLGQAARLLEAAGWSREGTRLVRDGEPLGLEILIRASIFERLLGGFVANLRRIGIDATIRLVDPAQFQARLNTFDFDMVGMAFSLTATPTADGMRQFFASETADREGSNNFPGAVSPVYDALIRHLAAVDSREDLVTALRVLDRVERARLDWIPNWHAANHFVAYWDRFGFKEPKPDYGWPVERLWWQDNEKAEALGRA